MWMRFTELVCGSIRRLISICRRVANKAVLDGVAAYERREGWKGDLPNIVLAGGDVESYKHPDWVQPVAKDTYVHGVVTAVEPKRVTVKLGTQIAVLTPEDSGVDTVCRGR